MVAMISALLWAGFVFTFFLAFTSLVVALGTEYTGAAKAIFQFAVVGLFGAAAMFCVIMAVLTYPGRF
jgi:hypothetical protein